MAKDTQNLSRTETTQERYQVIMNCQLVKGYTLEQVLENLALLFKKNKEVIRKIISQPDFVVKNDASIEQAKKIQKKLTKAGIGSRLHKIQVAGQSSASLSEGTQVICPKCSLLQLAGVECKSCGVIFSKHGQPSPIVNSQRTKQQDKPVNSADASWYSKGTNIVVLVVIGIAATLLIMSNLTKKEIDPDKVGIKYYEIEEVRFIDELAEPGYVTFVEFFADWCDACTTYLNHEKNYLLVKYPALAIRRIDISRKNGIYIASERFNRDIYKVPYFIIYDEDGHVFPPPYLRYVFNKF